MGDSGNGAIGTRQVIYIICLIAATYVFVVDWGTRQALLPEIVERKVSFGEDYQSVLTDLSIDQSSCPLQTEEGNPGYYCVINAPGFGSVFVPQYCTSVAFDRNKKVVSIKCTINYRMDEEFIGIEPSKMAHRSH